MLKLHDYFLVALSVISVTGCVRTWTLPNGKTKVPIKTKVYKNKMKYDVNLMHEVDTTVVYEEFNERYHVLTRLDKHVETSIYGVYRFYPNGSLSYFVLDRESPQNINDFNPQYHGYRGVYYLDKDKIKYDLFAPMNEWRWIGKLTGEFIFHGDTLFVKRDIAPNSLDKYVKRKLSRDYFQFKADW